MFLQQSRPSDFNGTLFASIHCVGCNLRFLFHASSFCSKQVSSYLALSGPHQPSVALKMIFHTKAALLLLIYQSPKKLTGVLIKLCVDIMLLCLGLLSGWTLWSTTLCTEAVPSFSARGCSPACHIKSTMGMPGSLSKKKHPETMLVKAL